MLLRKTLSPTWTWTKGLSIGLKEKVGELNEKKLNSSFDYSLLHQIRLKAERSSVALLSHAL